jgi:hypothetical protein
MDAGGICGGGEGWDGPEGLGRGCANWCKLGPSHNAVCSVCVPQPCLEGLGGGWFAGPLVGLGGILGEEERAGLGSFGIGLFVVGWFFRGCMVT